MKLGDPGQVYPLLWRHLSGSEHLASTPLALKHLKGYFADAPRPVVVLLDELDALLQKRQSILYHFFEWTGLQSARLVVVAIANTMDLPERLLSNRIASRMGLNRLNFIPYQYSQLEAIILHRLAPHRDWFHPDALEYVARRVSSVSGDARRAIAFASRAVDHVRMASAGGEPAPRSITLGVMTRVLNSAFTGTPVWALKACSGLQLIMLEAIAMAWRQQLSLYDAQFYNIAELFMQLCRNKQVTPVPGCAVIKGVLWQLVAAGLVRLEPGSGSIQVDTKIVMLYTEEDFALSVK
jgi:hypothetical protein